MSSVVSRPSLWLTSATDLSPGDRELRQLKASDPLSDSVVRLDRMSYTLRYFIGQIPLQIDTVVLLSLIMVRDFKAPIHLQTQSDDAISCYGKPEQRTKKISYMSSRSK